MVLRPGGKEGSPSGGADASANIKASLGVAASVQTSEEEQALLVFVVVVVEEEGSARFPAAVAGELVVVVADARRRRLLVSLKGSHHCVSMAVEGREGKNAIGKNSRKGTGWVG